MNVNNSKRFRHLGLWAVAVLLGMGLAATVARAASVADLYMAQLPVDDRSTSTRNRVLNDALARVLNKITGNPKYLQNSEVEKALKSPASYLEAYSYEDVDGVTQLNARFDVAAVNRLLAQADVPRWPDNRPRVLVWLVMRDYQTGTRVINASTQLSDDSAPVFQQLQSLSSDIGLPMVLPLMDLEDQLKLSPEQLWALDEDAISYASSRYNYDSLLVGRINVSGSGRWRIGWWYQKDAQFEVFNSEAEAFTSALTEGFSDLTSYLAGIYAVRGGADNGSTLMMSISGVYDFIDYAGVISYLDSLAVIYNYQVDQVSGDTLRVSVQLNGREELFQDALSLDKKLEPVAVIGAVSSGAMQLRWAD